jgi:hypothetical protein
MNVNHVIPQLSLLSYFACGRLKLFARGKERARFLIAAVKIGSPVVISTICLARKMKDKFYVTGFEHETRRLHIVVAWRQQRLGAMGGRQLHLAGGSPTSNVLMTSRSLPRSELRTALMRVSISIGIVSF